MKLRTVLIISLAVNAILISAVGYILAQDIKLKAPPAFIMINTSAPALPWAELLVAE